MAGLKHGLVCAGVAVVLSGAGAATHVSARAVPRVTVTGAVGVRERATSSPVTTITGEMLEKVPTGRTFDQIIATLPDSRDVKAGQLPDGWQAEQNGKQVRMWGPAQDHIRFRLDMNGSWVRDYAGKEATLQPSYRTMKDEPLKLTIGAWPKVDATPNLEGILTIPPQAAPGQRILIGVAPGYRDGTWQFDTNGNAVPLIKLEDVRDVEVIKSVLARPEPRPFITTFPAMGSFTRVKYTDPWGETLVDAPVSITPASPGSGSRSLTGASSLAFAGQAACVSGKFPAFDDAYGLLLDGKTELPVWGASSTTVMLGIPDKTPAGHHTISDGVSKIGVGVITIEGSLDQNKLWRGESTTMRLRVVGTDRQFPLAVLNRSPGVIAIDGGARQVVTTPGGADNAITRSVTGIQKGNFTIVYSVNAPGCGG